MSPYRVLAKSDTGEVMILAAMLSIDKRTYNRNIYIIERPIPKLYSLDMDELRELSHNMTTAANSYILYKYTIFLVDGSNKYEIIDRGGSRLGVPPQYTQSDCLIAAMNEYANDNLITIIDTM